MLRVTHSVFVQEMAYQIITKGLMLYFVILTQNISVTDSEMNGQS